MTTQHLVCHPCFGLRLLAKEADMTKHDQEQQDAARAATSEQARQDAGAKGAAEHRDTPQARHDKGQYQGQNPVEGGDHRFQDPQHQPFGNVRGKLAPLPSGAVRDALASGAECNGQLDALANSHGAAVVRTAVEAMAKDQNYGTSAAGWLARPQQ